MRNNYLFIAILSTAIMACGNDKKEYDATGTFEATEVTVSAKSTGEIKMFSVTEGQLIDSGTLVGKIDAYQLQQTSAQLEAQKRQLASSRSATDSRKLDLEKQLSSINQQITNAQRERQRFTELVNDGAVPRKQLDDINNQIKVLERQREATRDQIRSNNASLAEQSKGIAAQIEGISAQQRQIADQITNTEVKAPIKGTVLVCGAGRVRRHRQAPVQDGRHREYVSSCLHHLHPAAERQTRSEGEGVCRLWKRSEERIRRHRFMDFQSQ